jgi:glycosyltransferase involved in cell wall biosynthesis
VSKTLRILEAVADGRPGGGTTQVLQLVAQLAREPGCEVHLLSQRGSYALAQAAALGAAVHGLDFFGRGRFSPSVWQGARRLLRRLRPDLVHAHGARAALPLAAPWCPAGRPLIYSVHGYHFPPKPPGIRALGALAERWCSARAAATVFVCEHDRRLAEGQGILAQCRSQVIPNAIPTEGLPTAPLAENRLVFAGRLVEQKNPLLLIDILDRLRAEEVRLLVIGEGPLREPMRERAAGLGLLDSIEFRGALPHVDTLNALAGGGILLLPSRWEGLPLVALEAMAIGLPVVAAAVGGVPEIIAHGETGLLVEQPTPEAHAAAVRLLLHDHQLCDRLVARARRRVAERFSWTAAKQGYLELYRRLLDGASTAGPPR